MFKKFKDKLAEEMKQSPARLQASMQQLAQAVVSPSVSNTSSQSLSASNDNFSLTEEGDETPKNSPNHHQGFQSVDLTSPNSLGLSRRSSVSSVASTETTGTLFPIYEGSSNMYHLQSDMDQSASEADDNISPNLERVTKEQVYSAYRKVQTKYHKYRGRYTDLATHYKEMERVKSKLESLLVETQDKALRRIADLKEQCQLEQQAKAHLEEALRNDIEEKDHVIGTLNTKVMLLQATTAESPPSDLLVDFSSSPEEPPISTDNIALKSKFEKLESLLLKYKESLKKSKEKMSELTEDKNILERDLEALKTSNSEKFRILEDDLSISREEINNLRQQLNSMKRREEESAISLAENKLSIHRELEVKEEQIKKLNNELKTVDEAKENLSIELEKLSLKLNNKKDDDDVKAIQWEMQGKLIDLEEKMGIKHHEEVEKNRKLTEKIEFLKIENEKMKNYETELLKTRDDLNSKIQIYATAVQKAKEKIESQNVKIKELMENSSEGELEEKNVEILGIRSELKSCKSTVNDLKDQVKINSKEIEQLTREKSCLIANILDYKSKIEGLRNNCQSIKLQLREYRIKEEEEIVGVEKVLKDKLNKLRICEDNVESLEVLMRENEQQSAMIQQKNLEIEEISKKIENFNEIIHQNEQFSSEIQQLRLKIQQLDLEIIEKDDQMSQMMGKVETYDDMTRKNNKLIAEIDNLNFKIFDLSKLKQQLELTEMELSKAQQCITTNQAQQISSSSELTRELTQLKEKCKIYTDKLTESLEKYKNLEVENEKLKKNEQELIKLRLDCENYTKLFTENLEKARKLENDNETLKINWEMAERDLEKLRNEISIERMENEGIKNKEIDSLKLEISKKDNLIEETSSGLVNLQKKYSEQNEELSQLKIQLEIHRKLLQESQEKSKYFENEISLKQKILDTSEEDKSKLEANLRIKSEELLSITRQNQENIENLKIEEEKHKKSGEELKILQQNLSQVTLDLENTKKLFQQNEERMKQIEENNSSMENENLSLKNTLNSKNELIEKLKNLKNKQTKAIQELESRNEALRTSENISKSQHEEFINLQTKLSTLTMENEELSSKLSNFITQNAKFDAQSQELLMLRQKSETLQSECQNYKLEIKHLKEIDNNFQKDEANYKMKIKNLQELNSTLEIQIASLKSDIEEQIIMSKSIIEDKEKSHEEKMKQMEIENNQKDEKIKELADKESWTNSMLEELRKRSEKLENMEKFQNIDDMKNKDYLQTTMKSEEEKIEDERLHKLVEQLQLQLQNMESKLITSQAKESQLEILNEEFKKEIDRLKELIETAEAENGMRMSQLVKEFQAQLQDKDVQIQAALDKNFDRQQGYESELVQQYREQLRDFQVELTAKSEEIESLRAGQKEVQKLVETIADIKKEHANEVKQVERKWRTMKDKSEQLEGMEKEWQKDKFKEDSVEEKDEELENMSRVAMAAVQSNTGSFHSLQQTLVSQRRELAELRKIVKLRHDALEDSTEIEYLRNILYEYMMGRETLVLARVIAAVVKFDQDQTNTILKKEEDKLTLLGSLGLS